MVIDDHARLGARWLFDVANGRVVHRDVLPLRRLGKLGRQLCRLAEGVLPGLAGAAIKTRDLVF